MRNCFKSKSSFQDQANQFKKTLEGVFQQSCKKIRGTKRKIKPTEKVKFQVGDQVRIAIAKGAFSRGYNQKSKEEIYKVVKVSRKLPRVLYLLTTLNGENVEGKFYQEQLTKVLDQDEFIVEEFLEENDTHYKVKFQGYDEHEWLPKENVTNTIKDIL